MGGRNGNSPACSINSINYNMILKFAAISFLFLLVWKALSEVSEYIGNDVKKPEVITKKHKKLFKL